MRAYRIAYDGRPFYGFQRQPAVPTVEGALLSALDSLDVVEDPDETPPGYAAAGRTDRGVSAVAQTVALGGPDWLSPRALNGELPADVRAWAAADAPEGFHATRDAAWRAYAYHLHAPGADVDAARQLLARLEGTHDFHNLTAVSDRSVDTTRTVLGTDVTRDGEFLVVRVRSEGFLHEMVRRIVTLLSWTLDVGESSGPDGDPAGPARDHLPDRDPPDVDRVLSAEELSGPEGIGPAPPEPLVLTGVGYPDLDFEVDERARESLRDVFGTRRVEAAARAQVMGTVLDGTD